MREDALDWVKEQEERRERCQRILLVAAIAAAVGSLVSRLALLTSRLSPLGNTPRPSDTFKRTAVLPKRRYGCLAAKVPTAVSTLEIA